MDITTATDELYAGALDDFTPQRTALAKAARAEGDKALAEEIGKLRKPSTSAWAINMLVRSSPDEVDRLLDLGEAFRAAQDNLDGAQLRGLSRQRQALIGAVVESVRDVAEDHDRSISEAIATEVEQTFRAAMADADVAAAVRGGALTTAISASGLGSLKISDIAASTRPVLEVVRAAPSRRSAKGKPDPAAEAERAAKEERERAAKIAADQLVEAERAADIAADRLKEADDELDRANERRKELRAALEDLQKQIARMEKDLEAADDAIADAKEDRKLTQKGVAEAERALKSARSAVPS